MSEPAKTPRRAITVPAVLAALAAAAIVIHRLREIPQQARNIGTMMVLVITVGLIFLWTVTFSGLPWCRRLAIFVSVLLVAGGCRAFLKIEGVTGDLIPIIGLRHASSKAPTAQDPPPAHFSTKPIPSGAFPQFLGTDRNGIVQGVHLATNWTVQPPKVIWKADLGSAWSGFAIQDGLAVTMEQDGDSELITCRSLADGSFRWKHSTPTRYATTIGGEGPRSVPTIHEGKVLTLGATGWLTCLELATGKALWSVDARTVAGAKIPEWGVAGSPLILDERVIVSLGGSNGKSLLAFDLAFGKLLWSAGDDSSGYSSPTFATLSGSRQILIFNDHHLAGHDAVDGKLLWTHPWPATHPHIAVPISLSGNEIMASSGYGYGAERLRISQDTNHQWKAEQVWKSNQLKSKFANLLVHSTGLYGLDDGILVNFNTETGQRRWKDGRYGHGQMLLVGDMILIMAESGDVVLVQPSATEWIELARFKVFSDKTWNPPALAGNILLIRNNTQAAALELPTIPQR